MTRILPPILKSALLPLLLGSGLFLLNIHPYHDWGDDFAQYLQEAHNIAEGKPLTFSHYIYNPKFTYLGPQSYPPGFPFLLSISNTLGNNEIVAAQFLITFFLIMLGWLFYLLLIRHKIPWLLSLALVLTFWYHPWMLAQKAEVLSDIPFSFFFLLSIYLCEEDKIVKNLLWAGLAAGMAISIRSAGWVLPLAGIAMAAYSFFKQREKFLPFLSFTGMSVITSLIILLISGYWGTSHGYTAIFAGSGHDMIGSMMDNVNVYFAAINAFVAQQSGSWYFLMVLIQALLWVSLLLGFSEFKDSPFLIIIFLLYFLLLVIFPYQAGMRFFLPILPILFLIGARGWQKFSKRPLWIGLAVLVILNISYVPIRQHILESSSIVQAGPQEKESQELFGFIKDHLDKEAIIAFAKPRALAYYTQKATVATLWEISTPEFYQQTHALGANYYLYSSDIPYQALNKFVEKEKDRLKPVFINKKFRLYKLID